MAAGCNGFTRSQLMRASIARAGDGLPAIEPGMPAPAGTGLTRRAMLLRSAGLALAVYGAGRAVAPAVAEAATTEAAGGRRVLVSIFMDGGWDAMSLLAPTGDPRYAQLRPDLALAPGDGWAFEADDRLRWHPAAEGLKALWDDPGVGVAVAPAIGYGDANQSHFTSRHFWEVGDLDPLGTTGWLGRYLDRVGEPDVPIQGLSLATSLSPVLATSRVAVAAASDPVGYRYGSQNVWGAMEQRMHAAYAALGDLPAADPVTAQARRAQANAAALAGEIVHVGAAPATPAEAGYPTAASRFQTDLQHVARVLDTEIGGAPLPVRCVTLSGAGTYDHHASQAGRFADGIRTTAENLRAFWRDLELRGLADRVLVNVWSEFGRRPQENGSRGTDHGAAGASLVIGRGVRQGLVGEFPGLAPYSPTGTGGGLDRDGNLRHTTDFRGLYCALLEQWLQTEADGIIPGAAAFARPTLIG